MKHMLDCCGAEEGWMRIVAIYGKYVSHGANCINKDGTRSKTLEGYYTAVNCLFTARDFPPPVVFKDPTNMPWIALKI